MKRIIILFLSWWSIGFFMGFGQVNQHKIDSINILFQNASSDSTWVRHAMELGILMDTSQPKKAEDFFKQALKRLQGDYVYNDKLTMIALAYDCLGIIERRRNNYDKAFAYYLDALRVKEQAGDTINIGRSFHNIATLFGSQRNMDKAIYYMKKALPIRRLGDSIDYAISLKSYGYFLYRIKKLDSALIILDSAKVYFGNHMKRADANINIARVYNTQKRYQEAHIIQKENLAIYEQHEELERQANTLKDLAITARKLKDYSKARQYLNRSQKIAYGYGNKKLIGLLYKERYRIATKEQNFEQALSYYKTYQKYEDSAFTQTQTEKIRSLELEYQFEKEKLRDSLNYKAQEFQLTTIAKSQRSQKQLYAILFLLTLFGLIGIYIIFRYRRKIDQQNIQQQELETGLLTEKVNFLRFKIERLMADNKLRADFKEELLQKIKPLQEQGKSIGVIEDYQSILVQLKNQIQTEQRLDSVSDSLELTDEAFLLRLTEQFPQLTKSEREVCHMMYLNLSLKEIMNIRNTSMPSIKSTRYRIRKKLNVPKGEELELFIQRLFQH
ncbi:tetratricopeptide repeat protein [Aquimarina sp. 2201CG14-23]|uniref:tetratricopeptide repeat protein n=1 Tax=Aquimarina mycalae TaxID=3040073 RepID=UPI002477F795|nr:tetratricopeptide repeat protein [Aquimarina sp. 2201CG14-23]MDH7447528.1 tetratricopeptide repeat protein [Aquimarina sp. 2201CG14-23]